MIVAQETSIVARSGRRALHTIIFVAFTGMALKSLPKTSQWQNMRLIILSRNHEISYTTIDYPRRPLPNSIISHARRFPNFGRFLYSPFLDKINREKMCKCKCIKRAELNNVKRDLSVDFVGVARARASGRRLRDCMHGNRPLFFPGNECGITPSP